MYPCILFVALAFSLANAPVSSLLVVTWRQVGTRSRNSAVREATGTTVLVVSLNERHLKTRAKQEAKQRAAAKAAEEAKTKDTAKTLGAAKAKSKTDKKQRCVGQRQRCPGSV